MPMAYHNKLLGSLSKYNVILKVTFLKNNSTRQRVYTRIRLDPESRGSNHEVKVAADVGAFRGYFVFSPRIACFPLKLQIRFRYLYVKGIFSYL